MTNEERGHTISMVTVWGAVANMALSIMKLVAGLMGRSSAMVADAVHSFSDLFSDIVVLVMVRVASKGKDKSHDYGHGKFETLATVIISLLLLVVGARLMISAVERIRFVLEGGELEAPGRIALWAAVISIIVKELLYQWTSRVGKLVDSQAMVANAWHHRSDALSSVGSAVGIGGAILLGGKWTILDPVVGAVISIVIIVVAVQMAVPAINELTEASLPDNVENRIMDLIRAVSGVENVHDLRTRRSGPEIIIDVHIVVDPEMTVAAAHDITIEAETAVRKEFGEGTQLSIHVEPNEDSD